VSVGSRVAPGYDPEAGYVTDGLRVPDPWRALENMSDPRVQKWCESQSAAADAEVMGWPGHQELRARLSSLLSGGGLSPRRAGNLWFRTESPQPERPARIIVADSPYGAGRVLLDPATKPDGLGRPDVVLFVCPSPDATLVVAGLCSDGSEVCHIALIDVAASELLPKVPEPPTLGNRLHGVWWLPDSSGFLYIGLQGEPVNLDYQLYHYDLAAATVTRQDVPWIRQGLPRAFDMSDDGTVVVAIEDESNPRPVAVGERVGRSWQWRAIRPGYEGAVYGRVVGRQYVAISYVGCDRGRVVCIDLDAADPGDSEAWQEILAESDAVLATVAVVGDHLYVHGLRNTRSHLLLTSLDGSHRTEIPLPGEGNIAWMGLPITAAEPSADPGSYLFWFSNLASAPALLRSRPERPGELETVRALPSDGAELVELSETAPAHDGHDIVCQRLVRADVVDSNPLPTMIYAYGGFNIFTQADYNPVFAAFAEAGGQVVVAHIRGGGELGAAWWRGGRMAAKQQCFDDLHAVAEHLIAAGRTTPDKLAVQGASNGGLLTAISSMQRPDLWTAAVSRVGWVDLAGSARFPYLDRCSQAEIGDLTVADDVRRVMGYSPYHCVRDGAAYPAIWIDAAENDSRVAPQYPAKLAAAMQHANPANEVFFRLWPAAGHGTADQPATRCDIAAAWLSFVMKRVGLPLAPAGPGPGKPRLTAPTAVISEPGRPA
jgi:prolyl oligopeptidase